VLHIPPISSLDLVTLMVLDKESLFILRTNLI